MTAHSIRHRLEKLEATDTSRNKCVIWEDGTGSAEREIARRLAAGESSDAHFVIVSWLSGDPTDRSLTTNNEDIMLTETNPAPNGAADCPDPHQSQRSESMSGGG
jgi:hypothetical protein